MLALTPGLFVCLLSAGMASHPPIPVMELADHIERLKANDNLKFSQEYEVMLRHFVTFCMKKAGFVLHFLYSMPPVVKGTHLKVPQDISAAVITKLFIVKLVLFIEARNANILK